MTIKIGVISDTHIPFRARQLPAEVLQAFRDVDHIIHAGDITSLEVLEVLKRYAPVTAVSGNVDPPEVRELLRTREIITLKGYRIGITHGQGTTGRTLDRAVKCFDGDHVDCIVFGHSHIPFCDYVKGILLFNPGSPTDKRRNEFFSFGILELGDDIRANHVYFKQEKNI